MARKSKYSHAGSKNKVRNTVASPAGQGPSPMVSNVRPAAGAMASARLRPDSGEVVLSDKYSDLPFEMRRVGIITGIVLAVLIALWLIFK